MIVCRPRSSVSRHWFWALFLVAVGGPARPPLQAEEASALTWLKDVQTLPETLPDDAPQLPPLVSEQDTLKTWKQQRAQLRRAWLDYLGPLASAERPTPKLTTLHEDTVDGVIRRRVAYESEPGEKTEAYLLKPVKTDGETAGVVVFHSTVDHSIHQPAGVRGAAEKAFGMKLARRGYVTLCPRNFLWPTNDRIAAREQTERFQERHPKSKGMAKMLYDAQLAVDILAAQPEVDPSRIGAIGHSLGAKEALYLAAFDERVQVTVSSEGGIGTRFSNWDAPWYLGAEIRGGAFSRGHHEVLALIAPRPFLLIGGDTADGARSWPFIARALPVYRLYGSPPRVGQFHHRQGHAVPKSAEEKIYAWLDAYLPPSH